MQQRAEDSQKPEPQDYLDSSNTFYQGLLGYKPEQTSLQQVPESQWSESTRTRGLNPNSSGIYLPKNQTAIIRGENPLSLFHEYFGHGLYCEQTLSGRKLVNLEKKLLEEEKQEFGGKQPALEDIERFREKNQTFQELDKFRRQNLRIYERFALFTEFILSGEFGLNQEFEGKYNSLQGRDKEADGSVIKFSQTYGVESVIDFEQNYGILATFYDQGLARRATHQRTKRLLEGVYGDKQLKDIKFALLYGPKEEFSDIGVFVVSDNLEKFYTDWLNVIVVSQKDFEEGVPLFNVEISGPLVTGDLIIGDKAYFENSRKRLSEQQITEEAIEYNRCQLKEQIELANDPGEITGLSYAQYYLANYLALKEGKKLFTEEALSSYLEKRSIN